MTGRHRLVDDEALKMAALNRVLRGWIGYYRHANAKQVADSLDFWVERRMATWLGAKHTCGIRRVLRMYQHRQGGRKNLAVRDGREKRLFLYRMAELPLTRYPLHRRVNPYLEGRPTTLAADSEWPVSWRGGAPRSRVTSAAGTRRRLRSSRTVRSLPARSQRRRVSALTFQPVAQQAVNRPETRRVSLPEPDMWHQH